MRIDEVCNIYYDFVARAAHIENMQMLNESCMEVRTTNNDKSEYRFTDIPIGTKWIIVSLLEKNKDIADFFSPHVKNKYFEWFKSKVVEFFKLTLIPKKERIYFENLSLKSFLY